MKVKQGWAKKKKIQKENKEAKILTQGKKVHFMILKSVKSLNSSLKKA